MNLVHIKNLKVITNSCDIANLLGKTNPHFEIIICGGILMVDTHSLIGPIADHTFKNLNVDKAFIGITGIDIEKGITATDHIEAQTKKYIIRSAKRVIALCDHSKLGHISINYIAPVDVIDTFITDSESDSQFIEKLKSLDIEVITR
jgi:DeoR/GlpR family transcriptional regulator of sugar metabolism